MTNDRKPLDLSAANVAAALRAGITSEAPAEMEEPVLIAECDVSELLSPAADPVTAPDREPGRCACRARQTTQAARGDPMNRVPAMANDNTKANNKPGTDPAVRMTVITSDHGPINKTIDVGADGKLVSNSDSCRVWSGTVETSQPVTLTGLRRHSLGAWRTTQAMILGQIKPEYAKGDAPVPVVIEKKLARAPKGTIARTVKHFEFPAGVAHMMPVDFDKKQMPEEITARIDAAGGVVSLLQEIFPELALVGCVVRNSASSGLSLDGVPVEGSGGKHIFYLVADGSDIPRVIETMHKRLVNLGLGWIFISESGARLLRSPVDAAVNKPNGLSFEGAPMLRGGLTQDHEARRPEVIDGPPLDTRAAFPMLTAAEEAAVRDHQGQSQAQGGESRRTPRPKNMIATWRRRSPRRPGRHSRRCCARSGCGTGTSCRRNGRWSSTIQHRQQDRRRCHRRSCQLCERNAGRSTGRAFVRPQQGDGHARQSDRASVHQLLRAWRRHLRAHARRGGHCREAIDRAAPEAVLDVLAELLKRLMVETGAIDRLKAQAAERAGIGKSEINARLKPVLETLKQEEARAERAAAERAREARQGKSGDDDKVEVPAPSSTAPRGAVAELLDQLLAQVKADEPPMRNSEGRLLKVRD